MLHQSCIGIRVSRRTDRACVVSNLKQSIRAIIGCTTRTSQLKSDISVKSSREIRRKFTQIGLTASKNASRKYTYGTKQSGEMLKRLVISSFEKVQAMIRATVFSRRWKNRSGCVYQIQIRKGQHAIGSLLKCCYHCRKKIRLPQVVVAKYSDIFAGSPTNSQSNILGLRDIIFVSIDPAREG